MKGIRVRWTWWVERKGQVVRCHQVLIAGYSEIRSVNFALAQPITAADESCPPMFYMSPHWTYQPISFAAGKMAVTHVWRWA